MCFIAKIKVGFQQRREGPGEDIKRAEFAAPLISNRRTSSIRMRYDAVDISGVLAGPLRTIEGRALDALRQLT